MGFTRGTFEGVAVDKTFAMEKFHNELQHMRKSDLKDVTLKSYLAENIGSDYTPERFYADLGITNLNGMSVEKMINTGELNKWLFPEVVRDAIRQGLTYTPFYGTLVTGDESIPSTGLTMPSIDWTGVDRNDVNMRDVNEGATIPESEIIAWSTKNVTIKKKGRGIRQTYESIMFTPIDLAAVFFQELGTQLGADLDGELINIAINGDQADNSESAPVIGAATANTLLYSDLARAWVRFKRIGRNSTVMLCSEATALTIMAMSQFTTYATGPLVLANPLAPVIRPLVPLPTNQDILIHSDIPDTTIIFVDIARAFVQLTAMPLLLESDKIVSRQINGEFASIITGFANIFRDGRLVLDFSTNLSTNPGPTVLTRQS